MPDTTAATTVVLGTIGSRRQWDTRSLTSPAHPGPLQRRLSRAATPLWPLQISNRSGQSGEPFFSAFFSRKKSEACSSASLRFAWEVLNLGGQRVGTTGNGEDVRYLQDQWIWAVRATGAAALRRDLKTNG
jgi:hypothetical protein